MIAEQVVKPLVGQGAEICIFAPTHKFCDVIEAHLKSLGIACRHYRGRLQLDPLNPVHRMCRRSTVLESVERALWNADTDMCIKGNHICPLYEVCGYQAQMTHRAPVTVLPTTMLFKKCPEFIQCDCKVIFDEYWPNSQSGFDRPKILTLTELEQDRQVPNGKGGIWKCDSEFLSGLSQDFRDILRKEPLGHLRNYILHQTFDPGPVQELKILEWSRKKPSNILPDIPDDVAKKAADKVKSHNMQVSRLSRLWDLTGRSLASDTEFSPYLQKISADEIQMYWDDAIHKTWASPTLIADGSSEESIGKLFFPNLSSTLSVQVSRQFCSARQFGVKSFSTTSLLKPDGILDRIIVPYVRQRAVELGAQKIRIVCAKAIKDLLLLKELPGNAEIMHFHECIGAINGIDVSHLIVLGRSQLRTATAEEKSRVLFGTDILMLERDQEGRSSFPIVERFACTLRGSQHSIKTVEHPDKNCEIVRRSVSDRLIKTALMSVGAHIRGPANPLTIDIFNNLLVVDVDEVIETKDLRSKPISVMIAEGAVPKHYRDMFLAYPSLFKSAEAARKRLERDYPGHSSLNNILKELCPGFLEFPYRTAKRGPGGMLYYDPERIQPKHWLRERLPLARFD